MNRTLITFLIFFTVNAFSQNSIGIQIDSLKKEKSPISSDSLLKQTSQKVDTTILHFDKKELNIPISTDNLTKIVMVKEKTKVDWLKYLLPIFTLLLGIWVKELIEKRSNKKKIKKSGARWIAELRSVEEPLKKQIQTLEEYLVEHEKEDFEIQNLQVYSSLNGEIFKSLNKDELIKYIQLNNEKTDFKEIVKISNSTNGYVSIRCISMKL
ncbi:hypothetical protein N7U66_04905 [Lacinutrix neustonica]|uniref:Uncharacterized protein n=1 Tax=Lacinutrix neustonica TaxID=2980107 RepID=A0A9E8MXR9_9FLAO|nr:hypothetical protein [Lacinutrix neustonica]WAC02971.1 hypothetical protein N7U66_04905 [Lacinutrix neustonica]